MEVNGILKFILQQVVVLTLRRNNDNNDDPSVEVENDR